MMLLSKAILLWNLIRHLRRAPVDSAVPFVQSRHATFYDSSGKEWDLTISPDAEVSETNIIWSVVAGMETLAHQDS